MRKEISLGIVCMLVFLSTIIVQSESTDETPISQSSIFDNIIIIGTIINPHETNDTLTANALYLFYFQSGILIKKAGIVSGLTEFSLTKTPFFLTYTPGPFGKVSYIYGFAKDFTIID